MNNTVFAIGANSALSIDRGVNSWSKLGGYAKEISAGVNTTGKPEVYVIGGDNAAYVSDNGSGFSDLGGYVTEISATANGVLFARGKLVDSVYVSNNRLPFGFLGSVPLADPQRLWPTPPPRPPPRSSTTTSRRISTWNRGRWATAGCWRAWRRWRTVTHKYQKHVYL